MTDEAQENVGLKPVEMRGEKKKCRVKRGKSEGDAELAGAICCMFRLDE